MADVVTSGVCSSQFLMNSEGANDVNTCRKCKNYYVLLKEALEELNSIQTINRLLQKEQQVCAAPTDTWGLNNSDPTSCNNWTLVVKRNHMVKSNKQDKSEIPVTDKFIKNRYISLATIPTDTDTEGIIPVLVNGVAPTIGRVKMANKIIIQKETNEHDGSNHKKTSVKTSVSTKKKVP